MIAFNVLPHRTAVRQTERVQRARHVAHTGEELLAQIPDQRTNVGCANVPRRAGATTHWPFFLHSTPFAGRTVAVQCKRYGPGSKVGSPDVQTFIGMMTVHHRTDRSIFVTTS